MKIREDLKPCKYCGQAPWATTCNKNNWSISCPTFWKQKSCGVKCVNQPFTGAKATIEEAEKCWQNNEIYTNEPF